MLIVNLVALHELLDLLLVADVVLDINFLEPPVGPFAVELPLKGQILEHLALKRYLFELPGALHELAEVLHYLLLVGRVAHDVELRLHHLCHETAQSLDELQLLLMRLERTRLSLF